MLLVAIQWPYEGEYAYVEEVKLLRGAANRVGKEESITLEPAHLARGILETNTRARHFGYYMEGIC